MFVPAKLISASIVVTTAEKSSPSLIGTVADAVLEPLLMMNCRDPASMTFPPMNKSIVAGAIPGVVCDPSVALAAPNKGGFVVKKSLN